MNGYKYEHYVAKYLKKKRFKQIYVTKASGDYGADIIAKKYGQWYVIQCKYYSHSVGLKAVQEVVAAKKHYKCTKSMVVTNNTYTKPAKILAKENNVILLDNIKPHRSTRNNNLEIRLIFAAFFMFVLAIYILILTIKLID